ncbi:MAG: DUF7117 family protein [Halodesulfurarchaeum sp.]
MEVRGIRECKNCGRQWSYYETGSPACPECGSLYSVGIGDRHLHTDRPANLDLEEARDALDAGRYREAGEAVEATARQYVHRRGFVNGGDLRPLEDRYLVAHELRHVGHQLRQPMVEGLGGENVDLEYVETLFQAATDGTRPPAAAVPESMSGTRGLAVADAVSEYHDALKTWLDATETDQDVDGPLDQVDSHVRRFRALEGAVEPETAEHLVEAVRAIGTVLQTGTKTPEFEAALAALR